jgi:hypothetical protein
LRTMDLNHRTLVEVKLKEAGIMRRTGIEIFLVLSLELLVACFECGRIAWAEPEAKNVQLPEPSTQNFTPPKSAPLTEKKTPTNDPLYQAILRELRGDDTSEKRDTGEVPNGAASHAISNTKETEIESVLSSEDWLAIESILRSARRLEWEAKKRTESNQQDAAQSRLKIVAILRQQVVDLIAGSNSAGINSTKAQTRSY